MEPDYLESDFPVKRLLPPFILLCFLFSSCETANGYLPVPAATHTASPTPLTISTPQPPATETKVSVTSTLAATATPTELVQYNTIDIERPLETCPVITDISAYYDWVNGDLQRGGKYVPFGPDTKLIPFIKNNDGKDNTGPFWTIV